MNAVGQYIMRICAVALISGILCGLLKESFGYGILRTICSLVILLTVIRPITNITIKDVSHFWIPYSQEAKDTAAAGEQHSREAIQKIIKEETQAYILDKANEMGIQIRVLVTVSEDSIPIPISIQISGTVSPYNRQKLEQTIENDLNVSKENLVWIG